LEVGNALAKRFRVQGTEIIHYFLNSSDATVVHLNSLLFKRGLDLYESHDDKTWGLVDCVSFVVMREMEIEDALTFDKHFTQVRISSVKHGITRQLIPSPSRPIPRKASLSLS
jgi:uncharacterized protein